MNVHAMRQYDQARREGSVEGASPHQLILLLFDGALERISTARGALNRNNPADKARHLSVATGIIEGLRASTNPEAGEELAARLQDLYSYCNDRLLDGNLHNDDSALEEVSNLLRELRAGWNSIPSEFHGYQVAVTHAVGIGG